MHCKVTPPHLGLIAAVCMISTARDYAVFCQMFLNGGTYDGTRILSAESVELMTSPKIHIAGEGDDASYYGYGWRIDGGGYGHGGRTPSPRLYGWNSRR